MYNPKFYETYQNTVTPQNTNFDPYADQYFGKNDTTPYMQGVTNNTMPPGMLENRPYPLQSSTATPYLNNTPGYAKGGRVKKRPSYQELAERLRRQGQRGDEILAHINPQEAQMLQQMYGGDINPNTGLPQFGLFSNPGKWLKGSLGGGLGAVLGNMILPGVGGIVGGALGGAAGSALRGRKDYGSAALRGGLTGAFLPTAADMGSSIANSLGYEGLGKTLGEYGTTNAILPSLGIADTTATATTPTATSSSALAPGTVLRGGTTAASKPVSNVVAREAAKNAANTLVGNTTGATTLTASAPEASGSFWDKLMGNTKDYFTNPANVITAASAAAQALDRPKEKKEKTPEELADETKRLERALRTMSPEERAEMEAQLLADAQMKRRVERNKFIPEEKLGDIAPLYIRTNTPEEYKAQGKWLNYYDNPEFGGMPMPYKKGGHVISNMIGGGHPMEFPVDISGLIGGFGGGQDDNIRALLPENAYIVEGSTTSDLGDGNPEAGGNKIHALISSKEFYVSPKDVKKIGKGDVKAGVKTLDTMTKNVRKHKRGGVTLPPKAKSINSYIKGSK